jgi:hypothetical protein
MARADQIIELEDAFDAISDEFGEGVKFGNSNTNWSNTNATNHTCVAAELATAEMLEEGGYRPGKLQQIAVKKSSLINTPPTQQSTIAQFRSNLYRVVQVDHQDALFLITLADPSD